MNEVDKNNDGLISQAEFMESMANFLKKSVSDKMA